MNVRQAEAGRGRNLQVPTIRLMCLAATALAGAGYAKPSLAQEWTLTPSISEKAFYDDNLLLTPNNELSSFGLVTTPILKLERKSPTSTVDLTGRFPYTVYLDHSNLNAADQLVDLTANKALSERSTLAFTGDFQHDSTLRSEQDISDQFLTKQIRFTRFDASPSWTYLLGPIDQLTLSASYSDVNYATSGKTDYRYYGPTIAYQHQLNELSSITGSLQYNRFEPDDVAHTRTNVYGGLVGYQYEPNERLSVSGSVGMSYNVTTSDFTNEDDSLGYRFKFDLKYLMTDQTNLLVSLSHDSEPSGDGRQLTRNRAQVGFKYEVTELTTLGLDSSYVDNEDYFGVQGDQNSSEGLSRYFAVAPSVSFQLTEDLSLVAQYQFRHKIFQSEGGSATSNSAFLLLRYDLPTLDWGGL